MLGDEDSRWQSVEIRVRRYLNNIVEQDHRAIKRRCVSMLGLKSYRSAATTFAGIELAHRIRKGQFSIPVEVQGRTSTLEDLWNRALDCSTGLAGQSGGQIPSMHQISASRCPRGSMRVPRPGGRRSPRKIFFGRSRYLLVMPKGGQYWRYRYRYGGKDKTLALGVLPDESAAFAHDEPWALSSP